MSKTVVFFGTDDFSASALKALIGAGYSVSAVITKPDSKQGRGQQFSAPIVKQIALDHSIPVWQPVKLTDVTNDIKALGSVAGVLSSYGRIIPQEILDVFEPGIINVHPSLLPRYRGSSPIETAILNGDSETGVSIMQLVAAMDAGGVYARRSYSLTHTETQGELYEKLAGIGAELLVEVMPAILDGSLLPTPQDKSQASYTTLIRKEAGIIDTKKTAIELERQIRAYQTWPRSRTVVNGKDIIITKAHVSSDSSTMLDLACSDGKFLSIDELIAPNGRSMSAKDFLNGYAAG